MARYKVIHEREGCIACGACWGVCPDFWEQGDDGKSTLKNGKKNGDNFELIIGEKDLIGNKTAAESCPVNVIHVEEEKSKKRLI